MLFRSLALLETPAVRERFGLLETDLPLVRSWVEGTGVRWGIDGAHRQRLRLPNLSGNTWRNGLDRLLLGYSMAGHDGRTFQGILPFDNLEGAAATVLGCFVEFIERLVATVETLDQARRLGEWVVVLRELLVQFFQPSEESSMELQTIRGCLANLERQHALSGFDEPISLAVVLERLAPALEEDLSNSGFLTGGVTFCGFKPMRSIPFKIVCLVGLNDGAFPRPVYHLSFDLMAKAPRLGDRSTREDDRYLFLETLLSARQRLYLSYVGQSVRDNTEAPPSVLVSELIDYITQGFDLSENGGEVKAADRPDARENERDLLCHLVTRHRLQAFRDRKSVV